MRTGSKFLSGKFRYVLLFGAFLWGHATFSDLQEYLIADDKRW